MANVDPQNPRELGYYFALAQVGLEIVAPLCIGLYLDYLLGWSPWGLIAGTGLGFAGGLFHLVTLAKKQEGREKRPPEGPRF